MEGYQTQEQKDQEDKEVEEIRVINEEYENNKRCIQLNPDFYHFTVMCFYKDNIQKFKLDAKKLAKTVYQAQLIMLC